MPGVFDPFSDVVPGGGNPAAAPIRGATDGYPIGGGSPGWFGGLGGAATLFGGALGVYGNLQRGAALKRAYQADADALETEIQATKAAGSVQATQKTQKLQETIASQRALMASRGVALDGQGTPENIRATTQDRGDYDISQMWLANDYRTAELNQQKASLLQRGSAAESAGDIGAGASIINAAASVGGQQLIKSAIGVIDQGNWIEDAASSAGGFLKDFGNSILDLF